MLQDKALPWHQKHRKLIILSPITLLTAILFIYGYFHSTSEEFTTSFALPASYTLGALIPGYFLVETVSKGLLKLKGRVDYGLKNKRILLAGDKEECDNVEAQLHYSQLFDKKNITNIAANRTVPEQAQNSDNFTKYDLVILCFTGTNYAPISDQQAELLSKTLSTIGHDERVKTDIKANNSDEAVTGLIVLCPLGSLKDPDEKNKLIPEKHKWDTNPFKRPFTAVVNQAGRLLTDIFSLLITLPPRNDE
jgi:hypothetical protein